MLLAFLSNLQPALDVTLSTFLSKHFFQAVFHYACIMESKHKNTQNFTSFGKRCFSTLKLKKLNAKTKWWRFLFLQQAGFSDQFTSDVSLWRNCSFVPKFRTVRIPPGCICIWLYMYIWKTYHLYCRSFSERETMVFHIYFSLPQDANQKQGTISLYLR